MTKEQLIQIAQVPIKGTFEKNLNQGTIEPLPLIKGTFVSCKYEK